jgi:SAM-dependent methyltransferase
MLPGGRRRADPDEPVVCCLCQGTEHVQVYAAREDRDGVSLRDASPYSCATHSSRSHGQIVRCLRCGLIFMRPKLGADELVREYAHAIDPVYLDHIQARETTFRYNLGLVRDFIAPGARVLEIGSYCGAFLKVAREAGIDIVGVEPSAWACEASKHIADAKVVCGTVGDLPPDLRAFDVVAAWDVLEHFADPLEECRKVNELLPENGIFLFSTLMIDNWFPKLAGKHWPWLMDMHLFYFTEATVKHLLQESGFEIVRDTRYCHVVTLDYLLTKLGTLGVPVAGPLSGVVARYDWARTEIPFRFGDIKLFVCRKRADAAPRSATRSAAPSRRGGPTASAQ